jgi:hypothetical protein
MYYVHNKHNKVVRDLGSYLYFRMFNAGFDQEEFDKDITYLFNNLDNE